MEMFKLQSHISATPPRSKNLTRFKLGLIFLSRFSHRAELHVSFTASEQGRWLYSFTLRKKNQLQESRVRWLLRKVCDSSTKTFVAVWWGESGRTVEYAKVSSLVNFIHCEMSVVVPKWQRHVGSLGRLHYPTSLLTYPKQSPSYPAPPVSLSHRDRQRIEEYEKHR